MNNGHCSNQSSTYSVFPTIPESQSGLSSTPEEVLAGNNMSSENCVMEPATASSGMGPMGAILKADRLRTFR